MNLSHITTNLGTSHTDRAVVVGRLYRYKYRARNFNGWGDFSEPAYCYAASPPSQPQPPTLMAVDSTSIMLKMYTPDSTGGTDINSYELFIDGGEVNTPFTEVTSYTSAGGSNASLLIHTLTVAQNALITGKIYTFKFRASNSVGYSSFSKLTRIGLGMQSGAPLNLASDLTLNGPTYVQLNWDEVPDSDLPTLGYQVEFLDDDDIWKIVFNASSNPDALQTIISGLETGKLYQYRVYSVNFNGRSQPSDIFSIYACGLPRNISTPVYISSDKTSITISWGPVQDDGGCPIFDFKVERDEDGTGAGPWTEVNPQALYSRFDPEVTTFTCTLFPAVT